MFNHRFCLTESDVESKFIVKYLLPGLGYSDDLWHQQLRFEPNIILDFAIFSEANFPIIFSNKIPSLIIEAKHPNQDINKHIDQLKRYLLSLKVEAGLITNGREIRVYIPSHNHNEIDLIFQCFTSDYDNSIRLLREIVGRENLKKPRKSLANPYSSWKNHIVPTKRKVIRENNEMKVIAIYHNKGGVGKTTVSVNLAAALANKGKRVLLVDIDSQANSTFATGLAKFQLEEDDNLKDRNIGHLLASGEFDLIPDLVQKSKLFNNPEIDVIPSHISLIEKQSDFTTKAATRHRLKAKLDKVVDNYDIVIVDTPPSRDIYAQIALFAADYLIIPSDLKPFANQGLANVREFVDEVNEVRNVMNRENIDVLGVLPSKILTNAKYLDHVFPLQKKSVLENHNFPVLDSIIFERVSLSNCLNKTVDIGSLSIPDPKSVFEFSPQSDSVREFRNFAVEVLSRIGE